MKRLLLISLLALASHAEAEIGWTYDQCVEQWGQPYGHQVTLIGNGQGNGWCDVYLFPSGSCYKAVVIPRHDVGGAFPMFRGRVCSEERAQ
jgi:hypothetical protein